MVDGVQVVFFGPGAIADADWEHNLDVTRQHVRGDYGVLVAGHPESTGISATQRRRGAEMWRAIRVEPRIAVLTDSVYQRGVATAVSWVTPGSLRAFSVKHWRQGAAHAGADPRTVGLIRVALERMNEAYAAGLVFPR